MESCSSTQRYFTFVGAVQCLFALSAGVQSLDQETERKAGWMLKALAAVTFTYVGLNVYPLMGNRPIRQFFDLSVQKR